MNEVIPEIVPSTSTGQLGVMHLERYWNKCVLKRDGKLEQDSFRDEWKIDTTLLSVLGLGLEQTIVYVYRENPSFEEFESWILATSGAPDAKTVAKFNGLVAGNDDETVNESVPDVLTNDDLAFWDENGYVIVRNAVSREDCDQTVEMMCSYLGIERNVPDTWYKDHSSKQGIMVQLFQHPLLGQNRRSVKIQGAYEQLWKRTDLWVNTDRVGFNPPEIPGRPFQGPRLHWDVSIKLPIPFGTQGILYLADTAENQGAFTLVPGFQNRIEDWMRSLPPGTNPRTQNLYALRPKPIAAGAGDFIIWHQALPHGSSPNTSALPRFVQYINYAPIDEKENEEWI